MIQRSVPALCEPGIEASNFSYMSFSDQSWSRISLNSGTKCWPYKAMCTSRDLTEMARRTTQ